MPSRRAANHGTSPFADAYPKLARWIALDGYIEIGPTEWSRSVIRVLDMGGMIWESVDSNPSLDDALRDADAAVARWLREERGE